MAKRPNLKKKSFNFVNDLAKDIEDISAEIGISETALAVFSLRAYIAAYKTTKAEANNMTHKTQQAN